MPVPVGGKDGLTWERGMIAKPERDRWVTNNGMIGRIL
jgi:hypothetical protein